MMRSSRLFNHICTRNFSGRRKKVRNSRSLRLSQLHERYGLLSESTTISSDGDQLDSVQAAMAASSKDQTFDDYIKHASLSPWVPTPDMVGRAMLEIAGVNRDDVHFDIGSGDGRLNFLACDDPFYVKKTVGIDVDMKLVNFSRERAKVLMQNQSSTKISPNDKEVKEDKLVKHISDYSPDITFICADLLSDQLKETIDLSSCTVMTMYFVESSLRKLQPILDEHLGGSGCRIVTNNYKFDSDWAIPERVEIVSGLPIHLYVLD